VGVIMLTSTVNASSRAKIKRVLMANPLMMNEPKTIMTGAHYCSITNV